MNEALVNQVEELGLSNKEAKVYIANLMLGPAGVQQIADTSGIKRVTTYVILESLVNLGLVSQTTQAKRTLFNAEAPENLRRLLEKREQSLQDQKDQLEELLPELGKLSSLPTNVPTVKFYDSAEGIRTIMKTVMADAQAQRVKKIYGISNLDQLFEFFPEIKQSNANPSRISAGIYSQYLYTSSEGPIYHEGDAENNRLSRYIPLDQYPINGDLSVVGDTIVLLTLTGPHPIGVVIQSQPISMAMRSVFELAWAAASKFNKT